jgi:Asp-tRNA(Asn)/Glu-tRNA(Gln) amidotransferase A subunit family amidase
VAAPLANPLTDLGAVEAVSAMHSGELRASDYAAALLERYRATLDLNAFISIDPDRVMVAAREADRRREAGETLGPLHGLPIPVKDSVNTNDYPTTGGTRALMNFYPPDDAKLVKILKDAGGIVMGKTNIHELSFGWTSNNYNTGAVRNPYSKNRIPGGSSGGTAATIAAHVAPIGIAEDTEGSIRVPAALCGVYGFRPTLHRYPNTGVMPLQPMFDQVGPHARSMDDVMLFDHVVSGDSTPFANLSLEGMRIGLDRDYYFTGLDTEVDRITNAALSKLAVAGAIFVEVGVPDLEGLVGLTTNQCQSISVLETMDTYLNKYGAGLTIEELLEQASPDIQQAFKHAVLPGGDFAFTQAQYEEARDVHVPALRQTMADYFNDNDLAAMIFPTTMAPASPIGDDTTVDVNGERIGIEIAMARNIAPGSTSGIPGLVVPAGLTADGLPVSLEIDGPTGSDRKMLEIGKAMETVLGHIPPPKV